MSQAHAVESEMKREVKQEPKDVVDDLVDSLSTLTTIDEETTSMEAITIPKFSCVCMTHYFGEPIDEWIQHVNDNISFKVRTMGSYSKSVFACCIDTVVDIVNQNMGAEIEAFISGNFAMNHYLQAVHTRLMSNYICYKNYCKCHSLKRKSIVPERDDWYTTCVEFLDTDVQTQYAEIITAIMNLIVSLM